MSSLLNALSKSMQKNAPKTLRGRANMVGEVVSYGEKTIKVKLLSGPISGQEVDINPGNAKIEEFTKPSKAQTSKYTEVGGILRFDGVEAQPDGTYKANWTNSWIKHPGDDHHLLADQLVSYVDTGRTNRSGQPNVRLQVMNAESEARVSSLKEMQDKLAEAFKTDGGAMVIDVDGGQMGSLNLYLPGERTEEGYVRKDPVEHAASIIGDMDEDGVKAYEQTLADRGITIVPMRSIQVGGVTAEETAKAIQKAEEAGKQARIMSVNPFAYERPSIGIRLAGALARTGDDAISKEHADRLKEAFLTQANDTAKAAFHKDGWRGVSDTDLTEFFASQGVELKSHPEQAWNRASIHMQRFENGDDFFAAKTHESARYGAPYPALECTRELRAAYNVELSEAVMEAVAPKKAAAADTKAEAANTAKEAEAAEAEPEAEADMEDIDSMLDSIGDAEMEMD